MRSPARRWGALNAILWSTGSMEEGEEIWRNIAHGRVWTPPNLLCSPCCTRSRLDFAADERAGGLLCEGPVGDRMLDRLHVCAWGGDYVERPCGSEELSGNRLVFRCRDCFVADVAGMGAEFPAEALADQEKPLREMIGRILANPLKIPTFVTLSHQEDLFDPESPFLHLRKMMGNRRNEFRSYVPTYLRLDQAPSEKRVDYCLRVQRYLWFLWLTDRWNCV